MVAMLYLLKIILLLGLFNEISIKFLLNLPCQGLLILSGLNWDEVSWIILSSSSDESESIFVIFVLYNTGIKYGKYICGVARKHN